MGTVWFLYTTSSHKQNRKKTQQGAQKTRHKKKAFNENSESLGRQKLNSHSRRFPPSKELDTQRQKIKSAFSFKSALSLQTIRLPVTRKNHPIRTHQISQNVVGNRQNLWKRATVLHPSRRTMERCHLRFPNVRGSIGWVLGVRWRTGCIQVWHRTTRLSKRVFQQILTDFSYAVLGFSTSIRGYSMLVFSYVCW